MAKKSLKQSSRQTLPTPMLARRAAATGVAQALRARFPAAWSQSTAGVAVLLAAGVLCCAPTDVAHAAPLLPPGTLPVPRPVFATSGNATHNFNGNTLTVNQATQKAILNWNSFNIASDARVDFVQPGATAVALNRIFDANPSVIQGMLTANGQIYLINQNGILFDGSAQVNVNTLIASSLDISDTLFNEGLLTGTTFAPQFSDTSGLAGALIVEVGAQLQSANGGRILLFAPHVENRGTIITPDGQTILAAGNKVYLRSSTDPNLRGFLVEVDTGLAAPDLNKAAVNLGRIIAERGNISLVGLAVKQAGTLTATTSVSANGSIYLRARDTAAPNDINQPTTSELIATRGGSVHLTAGSVTEVLPDATDSSAIDDNVVFNPSQVDVQGDSILHEGLIHAPSGAVTLTAMTNPDPDRVALLNPTVAVPLPRSASRVTLATGSRIDVSGTRDLLLPMSSNQLEVELRGDELKDFPYQRDGILRGKKVTIDLAQGTTVADVSKQIAAVPKGIQQKSATGGSVVIKSEGDVALQAGAVIDISGGQIGYQSGFINTTKLVSQGRIYDIGSASPNRVYDGLSGVYSVDHVKWGITQDFNLGFAQWRPAFVAGADAGSVTVFGHALALDGDIIGGATAGAYQRTADKAPAGGKLSIQDYGIVGDATAATRIHDVVLQAGAANNAPAFGAAFDDSAPLTLSTDMLALGGITRLDIRRNGSILVTADADLQLPAGSELSLDGRSLEVQADIVAPGGKIALATHGVANQTTGALTIAPDRLISARGMWVNDSPDLPLGADLLSPAFIDGGSITLNAVGGLVLGDIAGGVYRPTILDVSGGGWLTTDGDLVKGNGGDLEVAGGLGGGSATVQLAAVMRGLALGDGGTLALRGNDVVIRNGVPALLAAGLAPSLADLTAGPLVLSNWLFNSLGFSALEIEGNQSLEVAPGTDLALVAPYLTLTPGYQSMASGADIYAFTRVEAAPELRGAADLSLALGGFPGTGSFLRVGAGANIHTDPGATVALSTAADGIAIAGTIHAPAGRITLDLNPAGSLIPYSASQALWLQAGSVLDVSGVRVTEPNVLGLRRGQVLAGGTVVLTADRGTIVTEAGSSINVSGTQAVFDLPVLSAGLSGGFQPTLIGSHAGSVRLTAAEGMLLDGALIAQPGAAPGMAGGTLAMTLTTANRNNNTQDNPFPAGERVIVLRAGDAPTVPAGLAPGDPIQLALPDDLNGLALFNTNRLAAGGFTAFSAKSENRIRFDGDSTLALARSLVFDAPQLDINGQQVNLSAGYLALGAGGFFQTPPSASGGAGRLQANAQWIDLIGHSAITGADTVALASSGDIRARGVPDAATNLPTGAFAVAGDLQLTAAQIYPTTFSNFQLNVGGDLAIAASGGAATPVLSAGGTLTLNATNIVQGGTLKAPFGTLALNATDTLTLTSGSLTSVSGAGLTVPFGKTQNGEDWVYSPLFGISLLIDTPPEKIVRLDAPNVTLAPGATVDLSGGGDLYAFEFVPGPGGSRNVLGNLLDGKANPSFAVVPWLNTAFAPYDTQYYLDAAIQPGDSIYLAGGAGLAAGNYAILPAQYALLPGAFLVTPVAGYQDLAPGQRANQLAGPTISAGYYTAAGTAIRDSRSAGFVVQPGAVARSGSEFRDSYANSFFAAQAIAAGNVTPPLPQDAGRIAIEVTQGLTLAGSRLLTGHAAGTRGAEADISATRLAVVSPGATGIPVDFVTLNAADLTALGAESLLIGGTRVSTVEGLDIHVGAEQVIIATSAGDPLTAPEVLIAASDTLTVNAGSVVAGSGAAPAAGRDLSLGYAYTGPVTDAAEIRRRDVNGDGVVSAADNLDGRGALLRAASADQVTITRANVIDRTRGTLIVEDGARLSGDRSLALDATRDTQVGASARIGAGALTQDSNLDGVIDANDNRIGGAVSLAAGRISLGDAAGAGVSDGLILNDALLAQLRDTGVLALRSYSTIDLFGATDLGAVDANGVPVLARLELIAAGLGGYANAGTTSTINARTVSLSSMAGDVYAGTPDGSGALVIAADRIINGGGNKDIRGFADVSLLAQQDIVGSGVGGLTVAGDLTLSAPRVTADSGADQRFAADGALLITQPVGVAPATPPSGLGARLAFNGATLRHEGRIELPAGSVSFSATGDTVLAAGSVTAVGGSVVNFDDVAVAVPGGRVNIASSGGNALIEAGAQVDASDNSGAAGAGTVSLSAPSGVAAVSGELHGARFVLDAYRLNENIAAVNNDFSALNTHLNSGGFAAGRDLRVRDGDVTVAAGDSVTTQHFRLATDNGAIQVQGVIDASAANGGSVILAASDNVSLDAGARIYARATQQGGDGGAVTLATRDGQVQLAADTLIDTSKYRYQPGDINVAGAGGGANAYTASFAAPPVQYTDALTVVFTPVADNSGASTLDVDGLGARAIKRYDGTDVRAGDLKAGETLKLVYDGTYFRLLPGQDGTVVLRAPRTGAGVGVGSANGSDVEIIAATGAAITGARSVVAEGVKRYDNISSIGGGGLNVATLNTESNSFVTAASGAGHSSQLQAQFANYHLRPGVEIHSIGDLTLAADWNLLTARYNGEPGALTLRAAGNLIFNGSLSDGFSTATSAGVLQDTSSWSYRLVGGADLSAANPLALLTPQMLAPGKGDVIINAGRLVRTGTGSIDVAAGRHFELGKALSGPNLDTAALYTAGRPSQAYPAGQFAALTGAYLAGGVFPTDGGDLSISTQGDIHGAVTPQLISQWLVRRGRTNADGTVNVGRQTAWALMFSAFRQNVGALGGGDVAIAAGGDIVNLSAVVPTTGRLIGANNTLPNPDNLVVTGGGDLTVAAGGDILSGLYYVGRGDAVLSAGGAIVTGRTVADSNPGGLSPNEPIHTVLALGDGRFTVRAGGDIDIETIVNPTVVPQNAAGATAANRTYFYTYGADAGVSLQSLAGDIGLKNNLAALQQAVNPSVAFQPTTPNVTDLNTLLVYPPALTAQALQGDIAVANSFTLFPAPYGNLQLLTAGSVTTPNDSVVINLSDADPALLLNPLRMLGPTVVNYSDTRSRLTPGDSASGSNRALVPVHLQGATPDSEPARIIARDGDIRGGRWYFSKSSHWFAGDDISDIRFEGQHVTENDVTSLVAGDDLFFSTPRNVLTGQQLANFNRIYLGGPGRLEVQAGGDVTLGNSEGIVTRANLSNSALPALGADVTVAAGLAPGAADYAAFIAAYFNDAQRQAVAAYVRQALADPALDDAQAVAAFNTLPARTQLAAPFMPQLRLAFYDLLKQAGREAAGLGGDYSRGFDAIATLFPGSAYDGDLSLLFSQIKTESGGGIVLLAPGGGVNAGQTTPAAEAGSTKGSDQLGIVAQDIGAMRAFVRDDFAVNESRVFTLKGGDILIWSSAGDIDAGRGAKTAVSAPAPVLITDAQGNTTLKFTSITGSGIRSILTDQSIAAGDVDLIAPTGEVNAGDAGIGAAGNLNIAAVRVVGADNIQVGGTSTGVPVASAGVGSGLAGLGNTGDAANAAAQAVAGLTNTESFKPSFLSIEVLGLGE